MSILLVNSNALQIPLADKSVNCIVTSPPYYGLRDYGTARWDGGDPECDHLAPPRGGRGEKSAKQVTSAGTQSYQYDHTCKKCGAIRVDNQIGLEKTPALYVSSLVSVFRECRRVLKDDGTLWLNLGDSYATDQKGGQKAKPGDLSYTNKGGLNIPKIKLNHGLKSKDLIGVPWMVAFALRADGWYLRSDIIWSKRNPMPESVMDRPTKSHEYIFLLSKSRKYYYDYQSILEPITESSAARLSQDVENQTGSTRANGGAKSNENMKAVGKAYSFKRNVKESPKPGEPLQHREDRDEMFYYGQRNKRSVWEVPTSPYSGAHFATYPPDLIEPCIKAGCQTGGIVLDPFSGSGVTAMVARKLGRHAIGLDISLTYIRECARERLSLDALEEWENGKKDKGSHLDLPLFSMLEKQ
jgi:DNA modification methylase